MIARKDKFGQKEIEGKNKDSEKMSHAIRKRRVRFLGHIMRTDKNRRTKKIFNNAYQNEYGNQCGSEVLRSTDNEFESLTT